MLIAGTLAPTVSAAPADPGAVSPLRSAGAAVNRLGLDTLLAIPLTAADVVLAPANLYGIAALLAQGAGGETRQALGAALGVGAEVDTAARWSRSLDRALDADAPDGEAKTVRTVTALWTTPGAPLKPAFRTTAEELFGARVDSADLKTPAAMEEINRWIAGRTAGRIERLLPAEGIDAAMVAVAATVFKGRWAEPFDPAATAAGPFAGTDGGAITLPMMHREFAAAACLEAADGSRAIILPYATGDLDMTVVLPPPGAAATRVALDGWLDRGAYRERPASLSLPRFTMRSSLDLAAGQAIAWVGALTGSADLTGIADGIGGVDRFLHAVSLTVDEQGTEGAAASAVTVSRGMRLDTFVMTVDRPFLVFVRHRPSDAILFAGWVVKPSAS